MKGSKYEVWRDGKPLVEVYQEDLLILKNCEVDPETCKHLQETRVWFIADDVEVVVVRGWKNGNNMMFQPKAEVKMLSD